MYERNPSGAGAASVTVTRTGMGASTWREFWEEILSGLAWAG